MAEGSGSSSFANQMLSRLIEKGLSSPEETELLLKKKLTEDENAKCIEAMKVSLLCPISQTRMNFPCRATTCQHVQCFDADIFIQENEMNPKTWRCPVCQKPAHFQHLRLDGFFMSILRSPRLPPNAKDINLEYRIIWEPLLPSDQLQ
uniref:E3 sumo-protein ligase pias3 isoform x2 n=1 Tax=Pseudodiaptomus poplesia TaxID=213370 RepID=A0A1S6GL60_9MAXI|nr:e3 sumo-protein ligase pias3 isoform x2 [Pseudodiaptomus poplesia]